MEDRTRGKSKHAKVITRVLGWDKLKTSDIAYYEQHGWEAEIDGDKKKITLTFKVHEPASRSKTHKHGSGV